MAQLHVCFWVRRMGSEVLSWEEPTGMSVSTQCRSARCAISYHLWAFLTLLHLLCISLCIFCVSLWTWHCWAASFRSCRVVGTAGLGVCGMGEEVSIIRSRFWTAYYWTKAIIGIRSHLQNYKICCSFSSCLSILLAPHQSKTHLPLGQGSLSLGVWVSKMSTFLLPPGQV